MDIKQFYPSITNDILEKAINFAKKHMTVTEKKTITIIHNHNHNCFDVTMGSRDEAETCELVRHYILSQLQMFVKKQDAGLYRVNGVT